MSHKNDKMYTHIYEIIGKERIMEWQKHYPGKRITPEMLMKVEKYQKIVADVEKTSSVGKAAKENGVCWKTANEKWKKTFENKAIELIVLFLNSALLCLQF
jgi:hypothetical protein